MRKTILITGATDGIGLETAKMLIVKGHRILLHGRNPTKLETVKQKLTELATEEAIETYIADLSKLSEVEALADSVSENHSQLDVLINNAGIYNAPELFTEDGIDIRFAVNTISPYLLMKKLLPLLKVSGRVINLSSAAQSPVDLNALAGVVQLTDGAAYAQSKLALTMWSRYIAQSFPDNGPVIVAINPGSMLGSKMVKQAYGVEGNDLRIGADILTQAALSDEFASANGLYFDNDQGQFASPHPDSLDNAKSEKVLDKIEVILTARTAG